MAQIEKRSEHIYRILVSCGRQPNGRQNYKRKTITLDPSLSARDKEKELQRQAVLFEDEVKGGKYLDGQNVRFSDFVVDWIKNYAEKQLEPKTLHSYKHYLEKRILPAIGHIRMGRIAPMHILQFMDNLSEKGMRSDGGKLSAESIRRCYCIISSVMSCAVNWQVITDNPCKRVKPPKEKTKKLKHLDENQTVILLNAISDEDLKYRLLVNMAIYGGFRVGELTALTWDDIDFTNATVTVNKALSYIPRSGTTVKTPKTESSNRTITMPECVMAMLQNHKEQQLIDKTKCADLWENNSLIFTQWNGNPIHPDTPYNWLKKFIIKYNKSVINNDKIPDEEKPSFLLPAITFHALRHTNATLLVCQKVDIKTISSRLGHAMTSTTLNIYAHSLKTADKSASDALQDLLGSKK